MSDTVIRAMRTGIQAIVGFAASGALVTIWQDYLNRHTVDPTVTIAIGLILTYVASWSQNTIEDKTGRKMLAIPVPKDRQLGDQAKASGYGAKTS